MSKNLLFFIMGNIALMALAWLTRKRRRLNNAVLVCTSSFLFLSIVETAYRNFLKPRQAFFEKGANRLVFQPDRLLGTQIAETGVFNSIKVTFAGDTVYNVRYTIVADSDKNSPGFSHRAGYRDPGSPIPKIIFLGCSFTFGQGVNDSETLAYRSGALLGVSTLNLGGIGFGIHHVYKLFLDKYAHQDNKNRLFVYTMIPDHVLRASGIYTWSAGPSFKLAGDSLVDNGMLPVPDDKLAYYSSLFGCFSFIKDGVVNIEEKRRAKRVSAEEYQKAYEMIRKMSRDAKRTGGRFILLFWDNLSPAGDPNLYYRPQLEDKLERLRNDSIDIIRVSDIFATGDPGYYIPKDGHPAAAAYDAVAKYLAKRLRAKS